MVLVTIWVVSISQLRKYIYPLIFVLSSNFIRQTSNPLADQKIEK